MGTKTGESRRKASILGWIKLAFLGIILSTFVHGAICANEPTESECRPYIEKALKEQHLETDETSKEKPLKAEFAHEEGESPEAEDSKEEIDDAKGTSAEDKADDDETEEQEVDADDENEGKEQEEETLGNDGGEEVSVENVEADDDDDEKGKKNTEDRDNDNDKNDDSNDDDEKTHVENRDTKEEDDDDKEDDESFERPIEIEVQEIQVDDDDDEDDAEGEDEGGDDKKKTDDDKTEEETKDDQSAEKDDAAEKEEDKEDDSEEIRKEDKVDESREKDETESKQDSEKVEGKKISVIKTAAKSEEEPSKKPAETPRKERETEESTETEDNTMAPEEEELIQEVVIPDNLRQRDHIDKILKLDGDSGLEKSLEKTIESTLKSLKGLYDSAIKPLEMLYKYRDLSNRHFGDPEIFSKPLILFMGPWSGGKSTTINYLLNNEFTQSSLKTGAEPSPAYFNILMHGEEEEILDGTQLAADWTFSGLQKFGQGLLDRLRGIRLPNKLLEKVNVVEIPGILEIRKQVQRIFPFNDACQWFIDRADIIFLVYDPSKLDVGPETEAILDQLKGRESQTRIILNKADQVKPEELMRVQGTLIWNISPLMSSTEPPIMYSTSLWSMPYEVGAPNRLLLAQERAFLRDLRNAIDKRVENKISSARRFAVRVRNHAKMVDCYLTTYYNHKSFFGNRKRISDDIIEHPQKYHIYEGLSTLTNISRYDLPDPDVYQDFFKINPLYEFKKLSETCTYFRGCPINKLDVVIAYDLPELVGKYRKAVEAAREQLQKDNR